MNLSETLVAKIDAELSAINVSVMSGTQTPERYKFLTGTHAGLTLAKFMLGEVLDDARRDNDD
jgi:hypothetical protein